MNEYQSVTREPGALAHSLQEAFAREVILDRVAHRRWENQSVRRHVRSALLLRRLAEKLDPGADQAHHNRLQPQPTPRYS